MERSRRNMSFSSNAAIPMQVKAASCPCENPHPNSSGPLGWENTAVAGKKLYFVNLEDGGAASRHSLGTSGFKKDSSVSDFLEHH